MIPLMKTAFSHEYDTRKSLADFLMRAPKLSMDEQCFAFEGEFAKKQGAKHCILFNSAEVRTSRCCKPSATLAA